MHLLRHLQNFNVHNLWPTVTLKGRRGNIGVGETGRRREIKSGNRQGKECEGGNGRSDEGVYDGKKVWFLNPVAVTIL